jgi:hypothetical protein
MKKIPEWQYPLYEKSDRVAYKALRNLGKSKIYPEITGTRNETNEFLRLLIIGQKSRDYRTLRDIVTNEIRKNEIDAPKILRMGRAALQNADESWAIFTQDKRICEMIGSLSSRKVEFSGNDREIIEFSARFMLSQMLQDWRGPLMAVLIECRKKKISLRKLNNLLKLWDYTKIF